MRNELNITTSAVGASNASATNHRPEFIRLPKSGHQCQLTGLSRSKLNQLILPTEANQFKPPVRSISIRQVGQQKGVRLIVVSSLLEFLSSFEVRSEQEIS